MGEVGHSLSIERRSGRGMGKAYVQRIETGESTNFSPRKLQALALGLDVLKGELFARVRGVVRSEIDALEENFSLNSGNFRPIGKRTSLEF